MTSIIQIADIHFGVEDEGAMAALAAMVSSLKPDVTVICGDITQNGKKEEFYAAREHCRGRRLLRLAITTRRCLDCYKDFLTPLGGITA